MTPLQKIAMGLVVIIVLARFGAGWDGLPDPLGWVLVLAGVWAARAHLPHTGTLLALGGIALVCAAITYPPAVADYLEPAAAWLVDLAQVAFEVVLCFGIAAVLAQPRGGVRLARRFRLLAWVLAMVGVLPGLAIGSDEPGVAAATAVTWALAQLVLVWSLFQVNRRPELGGFPRRVGRLRPGTQGMTNQCPIRCHKR